MFCSWRVRKYEIAMGVAYLRAYARRNIHGRRLEEYERGVARPTTSAEGEMRVGNKTCPC